MPRRFTSAILGAVLAACLSLPVAALAQGGPVPKLRDHPVSEIYRGRPASLILDDEAKRSFRTRLRNAAAEPPNFAGRFNVVTWGCGTNCLLGAVVNRKTGEVLKLPSVPGMELFDLKHRPDSSLLVATNRGYNSMDDEKRPTWFFFAFDGRRFRLVHKVVEPTKRWDDFPVEE